MDKIYTVNLWIYDQPERERLGVYGEDVDRVVTTKCFTDRTRATTYMRSQLRRLDRKHIGASGRVDELVLTD